MAEQPQGFFPSLEQNFFRPLGEALFGPPPPRRSESGTLLPPPAVIDNFIEEVNKNPYLSLSDRDSIIQQVLSDPSLLGELQNRVSMLQDQQMRLDAASREEAEQERIRREALERIGGIEQQGNEFYQGQIARFAADPNNPASGVRSDLFSTDRSFANALTSGDAGINANIARVRSNAALGAAGTGSLFSGKGATAVGNAENTAAGQRGENRNYLFGQAENALNTLQGDHLGFNERIAHARTDADSGLSPDYTGLQSFRAPSIDYTLPYQQQFGEAQAGFGRNLATAGLLTNTAGALFDGGLNAANLFASKLPGGK